MARAFVRLQRVATTALAGAGFALLPACGGGGFSLTPFWMPTGIAVADLDGDGRTDVAYVATYVGAGLPGRGRVSVLLRNGPATFAPPASYDVGAEPADLRIADLDGDGRPDLVTTHATANEVDVLLQDPQVPGRFRPATKSRIDGSPYRAAVGDVNGDGRPDIVVGGPIGGGGVLVLMQNPAQPGSFQAPQRLAGAASTWSVAIGDLNGDGWPDIAATTDLGILVWFATTARGGFGSPVALPTGPEARVVLIADVDGDGRADLVVLNRGDSNNNREGATIAVLRQNPVAPNAFIALPPRSVYRDPADLAVGDVNADGRPDLIAVWSTTPQAVGNLVEFSSRMTVMLGDPAHPGAFLSSGEYQGPDLADRLALGDVDGDGRLDVIVNRGPNSDQVSAFRQRADAPGLFLPWRELR